MKIAYLILAHSDPEGLKRLVAKLISHADVYIHINAKNEITPFLRMVDELGDNNSKIHFATKRERVNWGGYSIVKATFTLLNDALKTDDYDRITLLTGQDFPIKKEEKILRFYEDHKDTNYVTGMEYTAATKEELMLLECRDVRFIHLFLKVIIHPVQRRLRCFQRKDHVYVEGKRYAVYGISPKWSLTGETARYLLDFHNKNKAFNRFFATRHAPDDFYAATVLFNSEYRQKIDNTTGFFWLRFLPDNGGTKVLDEGDIDSIRQTDALFARKFDSKVSERLYEVL